jgi:peptidoglycan/xylan/chitin deacetylase (PgdA/CDA1 family)
VIQSINKKSDWQDVVILMYHDIYKTPRSRQYDHFYVLQSIYAQQLDALIGAGYSPLSLRDLCEAVESNIPPKQKSFVVTFDDGYASFSLIAAPILATSSIPATVFLVSEKVGTKNDWVEKDGFQTDPLMSWQEIEDIKRSHPLIDFQAHTATHVRLADIPLSAAKDELRRCKETIEQRLHARVDTICYPWGSVNDQVVDLARELGYHCGVTTEFGRVRDGDNPMLLPRVAMHHVPAFSLKFGPRWPNFWWRIRTRKDSRS